MSPSASVERFYRFMNEREAIRIRRQTQPFGPWTSDPILQQYKFTNVKREHDRTSRMLRQGFYSHGYHCNDRGVILFNCALARYFGTWEFAVSLGWQDRFLPGRIKNHARKRMNEGARVFTGAYVITNGGISGSKIDVVVDHYLTALWKKRNLITAYNEMESVHKALSTVEGFGGTGFMGKETLMDACYTRFWNMLSKDTMTRPADYDTWTPIGPGSKRGAARVAGVNTEAPGPDFTLSVCRQIFALRKQFWKHPKTKLELPDIQFQLCEFDKYERVRLGEGRPRSLFKPTRD